jgi:hypothetical protein
VSDRLTADNVARFVDRVNSDAEFRLAARFWNGRFRLGLGAEEAYVFRVRDGQIGEVNRQPTVFDEWDFEISGPAEGWQQILSPTPPPFYQDVASAILRHGFTLGGDVATFFAHHAALRRVIDLLRHTSAS